MHPGYQMEAVYICRTPVDFRKSTAGLSAMVEQAFGLNPFGNAARTESSAVGKNRR